MTPENMSASASWSSRERAQGAGETPGRHPRRQTSPAPVCQRAVHPDGHQDGHPQPQPGLAAPRVPNLRKNPSVLIIF